MAMAAPVTNTYLTTGAGSAVGQREDLSDMITNIDPTEVPFFSNARKDTQSNILTEWQEQLLDAVDTTAQPEGFEATFDAATPTTRPGNYAQILARSTIVSDTLDSVDTAGRAVELTYQKMLKGREVKRDLESALLSNTAKSGTDPRVMGGFPTWIVNGDWGSGGLAAAPTGDGSDVAVIDTGQAMSFDIFDKVLEDIYNDGGSPSQMLMTPNAKRQFSGINNAGDKLPVQNRITQTTPGEAAYIGSVSLYWSDYGALEVAIDRFAPGSSALGGAVEDSNAAPAPYESTFIIDKQHVSVASLPGRSFVVTGLAKTGDADKSMIVYEGTLKVEGHRAHGYIASSTIA